MKNVKIKVDAKGSAYWIAVDNTDVAVVNGQATVQLGAGIHYLTWWMTGKPGDSIAISAAAGSDSLGKVETKITSGQDMTAGTMKLEVK